MRSIGGGRVPVDDCLWGAIHNENATASARGETTSQDSQDFTVDKHFQLESERESFSG
jgi:hypothetical protein